jgi:hypothetical protein
MYRIEVAPGEETVFRTIEELAVGIRNGLVTQRSRIYHHASQKWLPIGLHPHYKKALEMRAASASHHSTPTPTPTPSQHRPRIEDARTTGEHRVPPASPAPKVPSPVVSPVVTMQQEVLRDLPVIAIPEPLPWAAPRTHAPPPPPPTPAHPPIAPPPPAPIARTGQAVQAQPTATVTYKPTVAAKPVVEPAHPHFAEPVHPHLEEPHPRPTARRAHRSGGRPLLMLGVAAVLVLAGHYALTASRSAAAAASDGGEPGEAATEPATAAEPEPDGDELGQDATPPAPAATESPARVTSAPARVRMTPGPAFAGSVPAAPGSDRPAPAAKAFAPAAMPSAAEAAPAIAPAPVELDLALPALPADSVVPKRTRDTTSMKKILRALNGEKAPETVPAAP